MGDQAGPGCMPRRGAPRVARARELSQMVVVYWHLGQLYWHDCVHVNDRFIPATQNIRFLGKTNVGQKYLFFPDPKI